MKEHELYMKRAVELALLAKGRTSPNPLVGAVIVKDGSIIGEGYHKGPGLAHAEIEAINSVTVDFTGSDMYVTLEPCNFHGKTPPCVERIETLPFRNIIIGMIDPNPKVNGKSIERLRNKGYNVITDVLSDDVHALNPYYTFFMKEGRPFIILKAAQSADGFIAPNRNGKFYLTCEKSRKIVHEMRTGIDAILIGSGTVNSDNPILDTRLTGREYKPAVIIADFSNRLDYSADIIKDRERRKIIFISDKYKNTAIKREDINYYFIDKKQAMWNIVKSDFHKENIISVLVEGGSSLFSSCIENSIPDEIMLFIAPMLLGEGKRLYHSANRVEMELIESKSIDNDMVMRYRCLQD